MTGLDYIIQSIQIPSITTAFVIGDFGYIYKYDNGFVDVKEPEQTNQNCNIYINSSNNYEDISLNIECETIGNVQLQMTDLLGNIVMQKEFQKNSFISELPLEQNFISGIYLLRIKINDSQIYYNKINIVR